MRVPGERCHLPAGMFCLGQFKATLGEMDFSHERVRVRSGPFIQHLGVQSVDCLSGAQDIVSESLKEVIHGRCP